MKNIKNLRELELVQQNLEYKVIISEKELLGSTIHIADTFTSGLKDWAFEWGTSLALKLILGNEKENPKDK